MATKESDRRVHPKAGATKAKAKEKTRAALTRQAQAKEAATVKRKQRQSKGACFVCVCVWQDRPQSCRMLLETPSLKVCCEIFDLGEEERDLTLMLEFGGVERLSNES